MRRMGTGKLRISTADVVPVAPVAPVVPVVRVALVVPEDPVVQVASVVLENPVEPVALVVPENPVVPVVPVVRVALVAPENPAVPELETGPAAALELVLVQVAVPLRTKSGITPHHRGQVPVPRVEDSAAAAETTRGPVAAEVGTAWEAAGTAVWVVAG